jgi:hypothetical protein
LDARTIAWADEGRHLNFSPRLAWLRILQIRAHPRTPSFQRFGELDLEELERLVEENGGFVGPVRPQQRELSSELDRRAAAESKAKR